jgi:hypothetical protein
MTQTLAELQAATEAVDTAAILLRFRQSFNELMDIDKHYQRKEHALVLLSGAAWNYWPVKSDVGQG